MKIKYVFADGTISEVEVDEDVAQIHLKTDREEQNYERKQRYHGHISLDTCDYEGEWFKDPNPTPHERMMMDLDLEEEKKSVNSFKTTLTSTQLRRLELREEGYSFRAIAEIEGTNLNAVQKSIEQVRKKYKDFFNK